jgi:hypothetical protein
VPGLEGILLTQTVKGGREEAKHYDAGLMCRISKTNVMQAPTDQNKALTTQSKAVTHNMKCHRL